MARYYDMDKLKALIEAKADTLVEGKEAFLYVAKWLDLLPHEDVVPRSEVEWLEKENEKLTINMNAYGLAAKRLAEEKRENVIELPCKVGTTLYFLYNSPYADKPDLTPRIYKTADWYFEVDKTGIVICTSDIHSFS